MRPNLTHIALHVADLDASLDFYRSYCGLSIVHERSDGSKRIVWLAEPGRETEMIMVVMPGGKPRVQAMDDYSHLGFALGSKQEVDTIAQRAKEEGCLVWEPRQEPFPVGYYCGVFDPDGHAVEFSYGQPLGPGAPALSDAPEP